MATTVRVKICGITSVDDAEAAVEAGADALGLVFYQGSPRCVTLEKATEISAVLPVSVARVGVFVDAEEEFVRDAIDAAGLDTIQLHGKETPEYCARFELVSVWKAFHMEGPDALGKLQGYPTSAWLLDSHVPGQLGGTGAKFNWDLAVAAKEFGRPIVLAGGLTPENVREAIDRVQPWGVDVSSGVERAPGRKIAARMKAFVEAVQGE
jgi:phosphoribosylanthranilate isomerase